jgi:hypothetical protein
LHTYKIDFPECHYHTGTIYYDKFIFNDTIITYEHSLLEIGNKPTYFNDAIEIDTKSYNIHYSTKYLNLYRLNSKNTFEELKHYIDLYKDSVSSDSIYYHPFSKRKKMAVQDFWANILIVLPLIGGSN